MGSLKGQIEGLGAQTDETEQSQGEDGQIVAELTKLLNHLMATGVNIPEVSQREMKVKERGKGLRRIGRFGVGADGKKVLIVAEEKSKLD